MSYIYLLIEREFIKTNENIFKIGRSNQNNDKRIKQYPTDSKLIIQTICSDCKFSEAEIISLFKIKYIHRNDIGNEYFEGDIFEMRRDINKIIDELDNLSIDELQKRAKEKIIDNKIKKNLEKQKLLKNKQEEIEILNKKKENIKKKLIEEIEILNKKKENIKKELIEEIAYIEKKTNKLKKKKEEESNNLELLLNKDNIQNINIEVNKDNIKNINIEVDKDNIQNINIEVDKDNIQNKKKENCDFLQEFICNEIIFINGHSIKRNIFREKYNYWCKEKEYPEDFSSNKYFSRIISKKGIKNSSSHGIRVYNNIRFKNY